MPTNHDAVAALPTAGGGNHVLLRDLLVKRMAYCLADSEDSQDVVAIDPADGTTILVFLYKGFVFSLDPLDATSTHDGISCLVSYDSKRYKLNTVSYPTSALDRDLTSPPISPSPSIGDVYLIYGSPSGGWAGHSGDIAVYTARGWEFVTPRIGQFLYIEDEGGYYHLDENGDWQGGFGAAPLAASSVNAGSLIGGRTDWVVVNQTTNTPPASSPSPSIGVAYIIGSSPTGAWAGHAASIAVWEGDDWGIYTPAEGWRAYDQGADGNYQFNGSAWAAASGAIVFFDSIFTQGTGSQTNAGSNAYVYSDGTAPTTSNRRRTDDITITRVARSGAKLRIKWRAFVTDSNTAGRAVALHRDSDANAIAWDYIPGTGLGIVTAEFIITAPDANSHIYKIVIVSGSTFVDSFSHRLFTLEEFS